MEEVCADTSNSVIVEVEAQAFQEKINLKDVEKVSSLLGGDSSDQRISQLSTGCKEQNKRQTERP